jgi:hypothetical protein
MTMLNPSAALLCKLGSIVVHVDELLSPDGHAFDRAALDTLLADPDLKSWLNEMDVAGLLPKKRA